MQTVNICDCIRTPIDRCGGGRSDICADDLGALPLIAVQQHHPALDWENVIDVISGRINQAGEDNRSVARIPLLPAGWPDFPLLLAAA